MVSESIQPLNSIGPMNDGTSFGGDDDFKNPARRDYVKGREQYTAGDYVAAAHSFSLRSSSALAAPSPPVACASRYKHR